MGTPLTGVNTIAVTEASARFTSGLGGQLLLINLDETNEIWISYAQVPAGDSTAVNIPPLGNVTMTDSAAMWAVCDHNATASMSVVPGGTNYSPSPEQIGEQLLPLAIDIAEQIAATGISLLGAPILLYDVAAGSGAAIPFGTNQSTYSAQIAAGVTGLTSSIIYTADIPNLDSHGFPTSWPAAKWGAGITIQVMDFAPDIDWVIGATHAQLVTEITNTLTGVPVGVTPVLMPYHECNLAGKSWTPEQIAQMDTLLIPIVHSVMPTALYGRGFTMFRIYSGGEDITPFISTTQKADFYGGDGYQGAALPTPDTIFDPLMTQVQSIYPEADFAIIETMTTGDVSAWLAAIGTYALRKNLFLVQTFFGSGGLGQPFNSSFVPAINTLSAQLASSGASFTIPAGGSVTIEAPQLLNPSPVAGYAEANAISYEITIALQAAAGSTSPFETVRLEAFNLDQASAPAINPIKWSIPVGSSSGNKTVITGRGPQRGQFLSLQFTNHDSVAHTLTMQMTGTSRTVPRDIWWWEAPNSAAVPGYTLPAGTNFALSLGSVNGTSVPAGSSISVLLSMFAGEVSYEFSTASASELQFLLVPQPTSVFGTGAIYNKTTATDAGEIFLPRAPCLLTIVNPGSSAVDAFAQVIASD